MLFRLEGLAVDEIFCAAQGYLGAHAMNTALGRAVVTPLQGGLFCGASAFIETIFDVTITDYMSGTRSWFGPLPIGLKNIVTYGLATYTTLLIMQVAGMILSISPVGHAIGATSLLLLAGSLIKHRLEKYDLEKNIQSFKSSQEYKNRTFIFDHNEKSHVVRLIANPNNEILNFTTIVKGGSAIQSGSPYILVIDSKTIQTPIEEIFAKHSLTGCHTICLEGAVDAANEIYVRHREKIYGS